MTLGFTVVQIVNTILSYFVMIKPVLGSSYRQYILSLWLPFYLSLPTFITSYGAESWSVTVVRGIRTTGCSPVFVSFILMIIFHAMRW